MLASPHAFAQERRAADDDDNIDEVVVTGTRVATRTRLDSLAPVDVLSADALAATGHHRARRGALDAAPSLNFPRPSITDGTDHIRPATLRGLAPDQTLVLVNSKRRHQSALVNVNGSSGRGSAAVDLNAIPLAAIETVEVLRDGASAQYGSDAIAGVINLRLREAREGGNATHHLRQVRHHGARPSAASATRTTATTMTASGWVGFAARPRRLSHALGGISRSRSHEPRRFRQPRARLAGHFALRRRRRHETRRSTSTRACRSATTGASTAGPATSSAKATRPRSRASSTTRATFRLSTRTASCR